ncbi:cytochrome C [Accumulibacter sp.]|uniref:cytochrome C n=1 Tax=Accumulibacter sp. TaxID=2053492 RepID=UPI002878AA8C|nr:cytochrome C [Accumulibacter sp.]MDS4055114.1 cytochrome C [Accumulibacter sp.]
MTLHRILSRRSILRGLRGVAALFVGSLLASASISPAIAVPSYARQTGADCAACHVGSFGPQLTPYGIRFKIGGYTDTDGKDGKIPLSAMAVANWTRTSKDLPERPPHFSDNNNTAMQEVSAFLAGRLSDHVGTFIQATYSGVERRTALDQFDIRYARSVNLADGEAVFGLALNGNPTLTDPFNTLGQWRFPYTASDFGFGTGSSPIVENLAGSVVGLNAYALWDNSIYFELGLYDSLSRRTTNRLNTSQVAAGGIEAGKFKGLGSYWGLAYFKDMKRDNFSVGLFGFDAQVADATSHGGSDRYRDLGLDASYQFLGNRANIFAVNASYVREWQKLNYTFKVLGSADNHDNTLDTYRLSASYHRDQTWGATLGLFKTRGSADGGLYSGESYTNRPDIAGHILQADWTPWGKETSWGAPWANLRLGVQYTGYTRFNGGSHYIDEVNGVNRSARDNNTTMLFLWLAI